MDVAWALGFCILCFGAFFLMPADYISVVVDLKHLLGNAQKVDKHKHKRKLNLITDCNELCARRV